MTCADDLNIALDNKEKNIRQDPLLCNDYYFSVLMIKMEIRA